MDAFSCVSGLVGDASLAENVLNCGAALPGVGLLANGRKVGNAVDSGRDASNAVEAVDTADDVHDVGNTIEATDDARDASNALDSASVPEEVAAGAPKSDSLVEANARTGSEAKASGHDRARAHATSGRSSAPPSSRDFAHGTHRDSAAAIMRSGLDEGVARGQSRGGQYSRRGGFHTIEVDATDAIGLQEAWLMGRRHAHESDCVVLICRLPSTTVDEMERAGDLVVESVPGMSRPQVVFLPGAYRRINVEAEWHLIDPGLR